MKNTPSLICVSAIAGVPQWVRNACGERVLAEAKRAAMIDLELIEDLDCFIPHMTMATFLDTVSREGGVPDLGLLLAPGLSLGSYGKWSGYVLGAATLGGSIRRAQHSIGFHSHGDRVSLFEDGELAHFNYCSSAQGLAGYSHVAAGAVGVMLSLCRYYLPRNWIPIRIELDIERPAKGIQAYEECFQCPVLFGRPQLAVVLEKTALETTRPVDLQVPVTTIEDLVRARHEPGERASLPGAIRSQIRTQVLAGSVSVELTALALDLSVRTLQRELTQVGSSYRNLVKQLRFERASELLREGNLNVSQIAAQLGYSTSAHFARAFRRESGLPPNEFRMLFGARNDLASQSETQGIQINESASTDNRKF